jgi:hypothetical protein
MKDKRILLIILVIVLFLWYQNTKKSSVCVPVSYINHSKFEIKGWESGATAAAPTVAYKIDGSVPSPLPTTTGFLIYDLTNVSDPNKLLSDLKKAEDTVLAVLAANSYADGAVVTLLSLTGADWGQAAADLGWEAAVSWGSFSKTNVIYNGSWIKLDSTTTTTPGPGKPVLIAGYYVKLDSNNKITLNNSYSYTDYKFANLPSS